MGGKNKGASISPEVEDAAQRLLDIGEEKFELGFPLMELGATNATDILAGGTGSFLPAIQNQLETSRSAQSAGLTSLREDLTRAGITGTEYENQMSSARLGAEQQVQGVPYEFLRPVLESTAQESFGLVPQGIQGIASAGSAGASAALPGYQAGGWLGALGGAAGGAVLGSMLAPGFGTLIGAGAGALLGSK